MSETLQLASTDRVLVFAPHPDDETLAAGELIQLARAAGTCVRVVFATDGEDNPWPQRWLEKRWHIGAAERARWARRRRGEAAAALAALGLDPARDARFLGWPDQGVTEVLMRSADGVATLAAEIAAFAPTHTVMPARGDRHPDHSALHVALNLALRDAGSACARLCYLVHGERGDAQAVAVPMDAACKQRKRAALEAHASQISLSRRRLFALAERTEWFELGATLRPWSPSVAESEPLRVALRGGWPARGEHELLLVQAAGVETLRLRVALPHRPAATMILLDADGRELSARWAAGAIELEPPFVAPTATLYAKVHRVGPRLVIYDREPWLELRGQAPSGAPRSVAGRPSAASVP